MNFPWDLQVYETLPSTQDQCIKLAHDDAQEGLVVQALSQEEGKGRRGRVWETGEGNLAFSFLLKPKSEARHIGHFSILIGVALVKAIGNQAVLKWPNDVLIDGKKCAGILIDSNLDGSDIHWLVVGIGANTQTAPDGCAVLNSDRDALRDKILSEVKRLHGVYEQDGFAPIRQAWLERSFEKGTVLNVGTFEDLDPEGNLVVRDGQNRLKTYSSGDVFLKDTHYAARD